MAEPSPESSRPLAPPASTARGAFARFSDALGAAQRAEIVTWLSRILLFVLVGSFVASFLEANYGMLTDPDLQNDDARTVLIAFHRYGEAKALAQDPIADEMLSLVPWGARALYLMFVPLVDVYLASKLVQAVAFGILLWAVVVLGRAKRAGLGPALLLLFLMLHTPFAVDRIAGGLPRAFGFPCFALWLSGVLSGRRSPRFAAPIILALTYPSVMNMILAAEGLLAVRGIGRTSAGVLLGRLRRYVFLVAACVVCVLPAAVGGEERGPIHTLEQAEKEPAFSRSGRLWILPFAKPIDAMSEAFMDPVTPRGTPVFPELTLVKKDPEIVAALLLCLFLCLPLLRLGSAAHVGAAFFVGTTVIYALSRLFAFSLYSPERYYSFGMRMACIGLFVASCAHLWFWITPRYRAALRNVSAAALIGMVWMLTGSGLEKNTGMTVSRSQERPLYDYIRTMPKDVRFATHILDGDGIPFWGARATTGSFETLQPWFTLSWARQKARAEATLRALYATEESQVLAFADEYRVTHFLVNEGRYGNSVKSKSGSFQPFTTYARDLLNGVKARDVVLGKVPKEAVEYASGRFSIVSVKKLRAAWSAGKKTPKREPRDAQPLNVEPRNAEPLNAEPPDAGLPDESE